VLKAAIGREMPLDDMGGGIVQVPLRHDYSRHAHRVCRIRRFWATSCPETRSGWREGCVTATPTPRQDRGRVWAGHRPLAQQRVSPCKRVANTSGRWWMPVIAASASPAGCCRRFHAGWRDAAEPVAQVGQPGRRTGDVRQMPFGAQPHGHDRPRWARVTCARVLARYANSEVREIGRSVAAEGLGTRLA
jgi:hypothetical protein